MRYAVLLILIASLAPAAESVFVDPTSGLSLKLPFDAANKVGSDVNTDALTMSTYAGWFQEEITSVVIMILKKDNAGVDLDEYIAASKVGFKGSDEIRDITAVPAKLGHGFFIIPTQKQNSGNLIYMNKINNCLVTITIMSTQATLPEFRKWVEANNP